jgi:hypothetical protein
VLWRNSQNYSQAIVNWSESALRQGEAMSSTTIALCVGGDLVLLVAQNSAQEDDMTPGSSQRQRTVARQLCDCGPHDNPTKRSISQRPAGPGGVSV